MEGSMTATGVQHPIAKLINEKLMSAGKVRKQLGMRPGTFYRVLRGERELTLAEGLKAAELFGVEVRELLP